MGKGYTYRCENCGKTYDVYPGMGMGYPSLCREVLAAVKAGEYGPKLKEAAESEKHVGVAAENRLYRCDGCGNWDVLPDASVYGWSDADRDEEIVYVARRGGEDKDYRLIEEYIPTCNRCGNEMRVERITERLRLTCHDCGVPLARDFAGFYWD